MRIKDSNRHLFNNQVYTDSTFQTSFERISITLYLHRSFSAQKWSKNYNSTLATNRKSILELLGNHSQFYSQVRRKLEGKKTKLHTMLARYQKIIERTQLKKWSKITLTRGFTIYQRVDTKNVSFSKVYKKQGARGMFSIKLVENSTHNSILHAKVWK